MRNDGMALNYMNKLCIGIFALITLLSGTVPLQTAHAATFYVTNTASGGPGSLPQAVQDADLAPSPPHMISITVTGTITLTGGQLVVGNDMTINGPGANLLTIQGGGSERIFFIGNGRTVEINGVTITGGTNRSTSGNAAGGGVYNQGTLTLRGVRVTNNSIEAYTGNATNNAKGAGIYNSGSLTLINSEVSNNTARAREGTTNMALGGGIYNGDPYSGPKTSLNVINATISTNTAVANENATNNYSQGGGLYNAVDGDSYLTSVTLNANTADAQNGTSTNAASGGNIFSDLEDDTVWVSHTILANGLIYSGSPSSTFQNCFGDVRSQDYNISSDTSCSLFTSIHDQTDTDPMLDPSLQNNGGTTFTHALLQGSPAIDTGDPNYSESALDQRGYLRIWDGDGNESSIVDIGAYEFGAPLLDIPALSQWGMIILVVLAGLGATYYLRREKTAKSY